MNIILQHMDGPLRPLDVASMHNMKQYAKMVGAEYELVSTASDRCVPKGIHA